VRELLLGLGVVTTLTSSSRGSRFQRGPGIRLPRACFRPSMIM
jgi:hypothetical protein